MFGKRKAADNPEVQEAIETRDALIAGVESAVAKVDDLKDELLRQYEQAER